jgi:hypothetical protein
MSGPLRIRAPRAPEAAAAAGTAGPIDGWMDRLMKLVPSEIVAVYLAGRGYAHRIEGWWPVICLVMLVIVRAWGTKDAGRGPQWPAVAISGASFVIWVFAVGGRFLTWQPDPDIAALLVLVWTTLIPVVYRGDAP